MSLARLLALVEGLEHSSPEGREDAEAVRWLMREHAELREARRLLSCLDDVPLDQGVPAAMAELHAQRDDARAQLTNAVRCDWSDQ